MQHGGLRPRQGRFFALLIAAYAVQSVLIGVRWGYGVDDVLLLQSALAPLIPALAWISFKSLAGDVPTSSLWLNLLPTLIVWGLLFFWRDAIDPFIILTFLGYGVTLLWVSRLGSDGLVSSRLEGARGVYVSLWITALALIGSALTDIFVIVDFMQNDGMNSGKLVAAANVLALLLLGIVASNAYAATASEEDEAGLSASKDMLDATKNDTEVAALVDALVQSDELYKNLELNLGKIARRLHLPARSVSNAINRVHGMSVSQYVNAYRVREACRLLSETADPIIQISLDAGFLTKSNFNREFLKVTGMSPSAWRVRHTVTDST